MASRQEEKERRKQERIEREQAEATAAQRKRLLQIAAGVVVAVVAVVGIVLATSGGKNDQAAPGGGSAPKVAIPERKVTDLEDAAKAAKCTLTNPPIAGNNHVTTKVKYKTNPPTSGDHAPPEQVASDGDYSGVAAPAPERYVHSLEHGRIIIQYKPGLAKRQIGQLNALFAENSKSDLGLNSVGGSFTLLLANNTKMPYDVAATAWGHMLACNTFNDGIFDAIRAFRQRYLLQGPEKVTEPE